MVLANMHELVKHAILLFLKHLSLPVSAEVIFTQF